MLPQGNFYSCFVSTPPGLVETLSSFNPFVDALCTHLVEPVPLTGAMQWNKADVKIAVSLVFIFLSLYCWQWAHRGTLDTSNDQPFFFFYDLDSGGGVQLHRAYHVLCNSCPHQWLKDSDIISCTPVPCTVLIEAVLKSSHLKYQSLLVTFSAFHFYHILSLLLSSVCFPK